MSQADQFKPGSKADERQRQSKAQRRCLDDALNRSRTGSVRCGEKEVAVCNEDGTFDMTDSKGHYKVVCDGDQFVGLAWDSDVHHFFRRVRYMGR